MWTYIDIIGFLLSLAVLLIWARNKKIGLFTEKIMLISIVSCVIFEGLQLLTGISIDNYIFNDYVVLLDKISLIFIVAEISSLFVYILSSSFTKGKDIVSLIIFVVLVALSIVFVNSKTTIYFYCLVLIFALVVVCLLSRKKINFLKRIAAYVMAIIDVIGIFASYLYPNIVYGTIIFVISLLVFILIGDNLENNYNIETGCFQYDALLSFLKDKFLNKKPLSLLYVYIFNDKNEILKEYSSNDEISSVVKFLKKKRLNPVRIQSNELIVCSANKNKIDSISNDLKVILDQYQSKINYANRVSGAIVYVEDIHIVDNVEDLFSLLISSRNKSNHNPLDTSIIKLDNTYVEKLRDELATLKEIDYAIANDGVVLNYQPVYSIALNKITAVEVLTRIKTSNNEILLPGKFIPVSEKYGRIVALGEEILKKACIFLNEMNNNGIKLDEISVNFSSYQLEDSAIINSIIDAVSTNKISPKSLCIEITNVEGVKRRKDFIKNINKLSSFGVSLSLSGYGKDNSGLEYLTEIPADAVRLDRKFVWKTIDDQKAGILLDNVIELARLFKTNIIAVGIENDKQFATMKEKKIDFIQGAYIGMPMDKDDFIKNIDKKVGESL